MIREFAPYQVKINKIYEIIEKEGSTKKELVLHNIKRIYLRVKSEYKDIEEIRNNADIILDKVIETIWDNIDKAPNKLDEFVITSYSIHYTKLYECAGWDHQGCRTGR